jgi:hypothetical protein
LAWRAKEKLELKASFNMNWCALFSEVLFFPVEVFITFTMVAECRVPCDHVPIRSWAFFRAREVMRGVIESFKGEKPR